MSVHVLVALLHVLTMVFFVGYALFFTIVALARTHHEGGDDTNAFLSRLAWTRWPPLVVPKPLRLPVHGLGWLALVVLAVTGMGLLHERGMTLDELSLKLILVGGVLGGQLALTIRPTRFAAVGTLVFALGVVAASVTVRSGVGLDLYRACTMLHLAALSLWIGHMVFWSIVVGPTAKRLQPPADAERLRTASSRFGGLGWPALTVLVATGVVLLGQRGIGVETFTSGALFTDPGLRRFGIKLVLVLGMVSYQALVGHRPAPKLIYANMLAAFVVIGLSVWFVRVA